MHVSVILAFVQAKMSLKMSLKRYGKLSTGLNATNICMRAAIAWPMARSTRCKCVYDVFDVMSILLNPFEKAQHLCTLQRKEEPASLSKGFKMLHLIYRGLKDRAVSIGHAKKLFKERALRVLQSSTSNGCAHAPSEYCLCIFIDSWSIVRFGTR